MASEEKERLYHQIAAFVNEIYREQGLPIGDYEVSYPIPDFYVTPSEEIFKKNWKSVTGVYEKVNGFDLKLEEVLKSNKSNLKSGFHEADIFFYSPFKMIVEYDERQHFNQFRRITLQSNLYVGYSGFASTTYTSLNQRIVKPGKKNNGSCYVNGDDPLFPPNEEENKQDNRHRQRAFRDYLKDLIAQEWSYKPTVRIPASLVKWKRNNLTHTDLKIIKEYLELILIPVTIND